MKRGAPTPIALVVLLAGALGRAQERPDPQTTEPPVEVRFTGDVGGASALEEVLRELLGRLGVAIHASYVEGFELRDVVTPGPASPAVARAWVDLRSPDEATLYLVDAPWEHVLVRKVPLPDGLDEIAREELGHILHSAVETLLAGGRVGRPREEVRVSLGVAEERPRTPPPVESPALAVDLGVFYEVQGFSNVEPILHGPGASVSVGGRGGRWRPGAALSAAYRFPVSVWGEQIGVELEGAALRLQGALALRARERLTLQAGLGGGLDLVHVAPEKRAGGAADLRPARLTTVPFARASIGAHVQLSTAVTLDVAIALDADLERARYFARDDGGRETILAPWRVRPSLLLGLSSEVL